MISDDQKRSFIEDLNNHPAIVLLVKGNEADVGGNAVIIAPYIAITATHVILTNKFSSFSDIDPSEINIKERYYPKESLNVLMYSKKYKQHFLLNVAKMVNIPNSDLSILFLSDPSGKIAEDVWNTVELCLTPPEIGEHVFTIGSVFNKDDSKILDNILYLNPQYVASFGSVIDFKLNKTSRFHAGFYAELTTFNTLSGSPVYNKNKQIVGLISQGLDYEKPTAFIPILYPIFINEVSWEPKTLKKTNPYLLYDLAVKGIINCDSLDAIEIKNGKVNLYLPKSLRE
jgi:hypothetical protein